MNKLVYLFLLCLFNSLTGQEFIEVTSSDVNIRLQASSSSTVVGQGAEGMVFIYKGDESGWCMMVITSGEYRYIHGSLCKKADYSITLPSESIQKSLFKDLVIAEDKATAEADKKYPNDIMKNIDYQRVLDDRYKLKAFIKHDLQPPIYHKVIGKGAKERW